MIPAQLLVYGEAGENIIKDVLPNTSTSHTAKTKYAPSAAFVFITCVILAVILLAFGIPPAPAILIPGALFAFGLYWNTRTRRDNEQAYVTSAREAQDKRVNTWRAVTQYGVDVRDAGFDKADLPAVYGALGERNTDKYLQRALTSPQAQGKGPFVIMHGLAINAVKTNIKTSDTSADIDHLVLRENHGGVIVDTKVFRTPPTPTPTPASTSTHGAHGYILKRDTPHWQIISTCLYEAVRLGTPPHAIYIAIGGSAARDATFTQLCEKHNNKIPITSYVKRFQAETTATTPLPVYLVPQREVGNIVLADLLQVPYAAHPYSELSSQAILANNDIYIDPTPTASIPQT